jgi:hypothetical protein
MSCLRPAAEAIEFLVGAGVTDFSFPQVSVASSGGEYFQVSFTDSDDSDDAYFLLQRQFESYDGGFFYIESHERTLCGHFKITRAVLGRSVLRLELASKPAGKVQIRFQADDARFNQLRRVLKIMIPSSVLKIE